MWVMPVTTNAQHDVPALLAPWLAQHPGVTVRVTVLDWESGWNKITAAAASRRGPDLLELGSTWMPAIAAMGGLEPLSAAQLAEVGNGAPYYPELWKTTQVFGQKGVYGLPWYADVRAAFYRTDVFRQAGVDPAQAFATWDSFHAALKKINGTHGRRQARGRARVRGQERLERRPQPRAVDLERRRRRAQRRRQALRARLAAGAARDRLLLVAGRRGPGAVQRAGEGLRHPRRRVGRRRLRRDLLGAVADAPHLRGARGLGGARATSTSRRTPPARTATPRSSAAPTWPSSRARATRPRPGTS